MKSEVVSRLALLKPRLCHRRIFRWRNSTFVTILLLHLGQKKCTFSIFIITFSDPPTVILRLGFFFFHVKFRRSSVFDHAGSDHAGARHRPRVKGQVNGLIPPPHLCTRLCALLPLLSPAKPSETDPSACCSPRSRAGLTRARLPRLPRLQLLSLGRRRNNQPR